MSCAHVGWGWLLHVRREWLLHVRRGSLLHVHDRIALLYTINEAVHACLCDCEHLPLQRLDALVGAGLCGALSFGEARKNIVRHITKRSLMVRSLIACISRLEE